MTVSELINALRSFDGDVEVNFGDQDGREYSVDSLDEVVYESPDRRGEFVIAELMGTEF